MPGARWQVVAVLVVCTPFLAAAQAFHSDDDAGSGRDAPDGFAGAVPILPGRLYEGSLRGPALDARDTYRFEVDAGEAVEGRVQGIFGCATLVDMHGVTADGACSYSEAWEVLDEPPMRATATQAGTWFLRIPSSAPADYRFGVGVDGAAPDPGLGLPGVLPRGGGGGSDGEGEDDAGDDAGSGRDAPADDRSRAVSVQPGTLYRGRLRFALADEYDVYSFEGRKGDRLEVRVQGTTGCGRIENAAGQSFASVCSYSEANEANVFGPARWTVVANATWYLVVFSFTPADYRFGFQMNRTAPDAGLGLLRVPQDDAGSGGDAPNGVADDVWIEDGRVYDGWVGPIGVDAADFYAFHANAGDLLNVHLRGNGTCADFFEPGGRSFFGPCSYGEADSLFNPRPPLRAAVGGTWHLRVDTNGAGPYRFSLGRNGSAADLGPGTVPSLQDDAGSGRDAPSERDGAVPIDGGTVYEGMFLGWIVDDTDTYAFAVLPGDRVQVRVASMEACIELQDENGAELASTCSFGEFLPGTASATAARAGTWFLQVTGLVAGSYRFSMGRSANAPDPARPTPLPSGGPAAGAEEACPGAPSAELNATFGAAPELGGLSWAALKTGFRAVVAWSTSDGVTGALRYALNNGTWVTIAEPTPRTHHVFLLDRLPVGAVLCFVAASGAATAAPHALRLGNAMNARDDASGTYSINLLVLASEEVTSRQVLETGLARFAEKLWDGADGHVRAGTTFVLYGDPERHQSGWYTCYIPFLLSPLDGPTCNRLHDVVITHEEVPLYAGSTYRDAIQNRNAAIWLNALWEAPNWDFVSDEYNVEEFSSVLLHELGHYAFGALDLYADLGTGPECYDPVTDISIMGSDRRATEFDDETNRCPNEAFISGYVPTWTLLRERYPDVPERSGAPDVGPTGDGGAFALRTFAFAPGREL